MDVELLVGLGHAEDRHVKFLKSATWDFFPLQMRALVLPRQCQKALLHEA